MKTASTLLFAASALTLAACQPAATDNGSADNAVENASEAIDNAAEAIDNASEALDSVDSNATGDKPAGDAAEAGNTAAPAGDKPAE